MTVAPIAFDAVFPIQGPVVDLEVLGGGHIHTTYLVTGADTRYVVQRLNRTVFPDVDVLMANARRVQRHLADRALRVATPVATRAGRDFFEADDGSAWRAFEFLEGTVGRTVVTDGDDVYEVARTFGAFLAALDDLPAPPLGITIPHFHDLSHRIAALDTAITRDAWGRRAEVQPVLERARDLARRVEGELAPVLADLPVRVVHNDAKVGNVRFASGTQRAVAVVDLDTVMPGTALHDVGELVRTATSRALEDAGGAVGPNAFDLELLDALARGWFAGTGELLTDVEVEALAWGGPWLAIENALRFLTDHLDGDWYFRIDRPDQNLDRAGTQLDLTEQMLARFDELQACFARAARP